MRTILFPTMLFLILGSIELAAQTTNYWVLLSDKDNTPYSIDVPEDFLSPRALQRRANQTIAIDARDLPVDPEYIASVDAIENVTIRYGSKWFNAIAVNCDSLAAAQIGALPFVSQVRRAHLLKGETLPDDAVLADLHEIQYSDLRLPIDYGLSRNQIEDLNGQVLHDLGYEGEGMVIAILDSGFDHVDSMATLMHLFETGRILSTRDFVEGDSDVYDEHSHGRFVLSCIAGVKEGEAYGTATQASFHLLRTEDVGSETTVEEYNWIAGAEYADSVGADVLNTSLGYTSYDDSLASYTYADMDGNTAWITRGADIAASRGMLVVNSAGNSGNNEFHYIGAPADADSVLAIGSIDSDSLHTSFSSFGPSFDGRVKPNVCAQGREAVGINENDEVVLINGTSFSSPILAGLATCLWQAHPEASNMQVFSAIEMSADHYTDPNDSLGYGIPNFALALDILQEMTSNLTEFTSDGLSMYPNPAGASLELQLLGTWNPLSIDLQMFDIQGRVVKVRPTLIGTNRISFNLIDLSSGAYVIRVIERERSAQRIFIKQ